MKNDKVGLHFLIVMFCCIRDTYHLLGVKLLYSFFFMCIKGFFYMHLDFLMF
jgi:hypothetical protein